MSGGENVDLLARWDRLERGYLRRVEDAYAAPGAWTDRLRAAATETFRLVEAHPRGARFIVVEAFSIGASGRARQQALLARLATMIDDVRLQLGDPQRVPEITAAWVVGIFFDRIFRALAAGREGELAAQLPELMFLAVSAYLGTDAGRAEL